MSYLLCGSFDRPESSTDVRQGGVDDESAVSCSWSIVQLIVTEKVGLGSVIALLYDFRVGK